MPEKWGGRAAQAWVAAVLATYGDTCHLCQHGGADSGDHLVPRSVDPSLQFVVSNGRPVHHIEPCPRGCGRCNIRRKAGPITTARRVDAVEFFERTP